MGSAEAVFTIVLCDGQPVLVDSSNHAHDVPVDAWWSDSPADAWARFATEQTAEADALNADASAAKLRAAAALAQWAEATAPTDKTQPARHFHKLLDIAKSNERLRQSIAKFLTKHPVAKCAECGGEFVPRGAGAAARWCSAQCRRGK